jgi:hypothetical protein
MHGIMMIGNNKTFTWKCDESKAKQHMMIGSLTGTPKALSIYSSRLRGFDLGILLSRRE